MTTECKDNGDSNSLCESCYLNKDISKLSGEIANCKGGRSFNVSSFNPTCNWTNKNCGKDFCDDLKGKSKALCKNILNKSLNSSSDLETVMNNLENGLDDDKDKIKVYKSTLKKLLCDIGVSSGSKKGKEDIKSVYSEYYWYYQNTWDKKSSANQLMTVIAYIIIFTMLINTIKTFVINPFNLVKGRTDSPGGTRKFPIMMAIILFIIICVGLFTVVIRIWGKAVTKTKKKEIKTKINTDIDGIGELPAPTISFDTTSKPITDTINYLLFVLILIVSIILIAMKLIAKNISFSSIFMITLLVIPYFLLTSFTYTYAPKIMLFYTLCLLFVNFTIISIMKMGKQTYLYTMILFNLVIIIFSWWIYLTASNIDTEEPTKENEKMGRNGYLYWIAIYVTVFSLIKVILFISGLLNIPVISSLSSIFLDDTRSTNLSNSVNKLVNNYYGFLNEDLIFEVMNFVYKDMGLK